MKDRSPTMWHALTCKIREEKSSMKFNPSWLALIAGVFLAGCASYPKSVQVPEGTLLIGYSAASEGGVIQGQARWSGVIAKVQNNPTSTRLEVVYFDSNVHGRPKVSDETPGRFVAYVPGFLDPMVYQSGKQITVLGQLAPVETAMVDQYEYRFPVLQQAVIHLWPAQQEQRVDVIQPWPLWHSPYPYWSYGPHYRLRTTIPVSEQPTQGPVNHVDNSSQGQIQR